MEPAVRPVHRLKPGADHHLYFLSNTSIYGPFMEVHDDKR